MKKTRFCSSCGEKMELIQRDGVLFYVNADGEEWRYKEKFSIKTGKPLGLYRCPRFIGFAKHTFFSDKYITNDHDSYSEVE